MLAKFVCWLGFHDWKKIAHLQRDSGWKAASISEGTGWECFRCGLTKSTSWDWV